MRPREATISLIAAALLAPPVSGAVEDGGPLVLSDLDTYQAALAGVPGDSPAEPVSFGDLWEDPGRWEGLRVAVEGRARRRFHQGRLGEYPPLVELWVADGSGNPTCLVYPEPEGGDPTPLGASVRFEGTFLKRLRYEAGDEPRLAPLVVGPGPPEVVAAPPDAGLLGPEGPFGRVEWLVGAVVAAMLLSTFLRLVLLRPVRRGTRDRAPAEGGPDPQFVDGDPASYHEGNITNGTPGTPPFIDRDHAPDH